MPVSGGQNDLRQLPGTLFRATDEGAHQGSDALFGSADLGKTSGIGSIAPGRWFEESTNPF